MKNTVKPSPLLLPVISYLAMEFKVLKTWYGRQLELFQQGFKGHSALRGFVILKVRSRSLVFDRIERLENLLQWCSILHLRLNISENIPVSSSICMREGKISLQLSQNVPSCKSQLCFLLNHPVQVIKRTLHSPRNKNMLVFLSAVYELFNLWVA